MIRSAITGRGALLIALGAAIWALCVWGVLYTDTWMSLLDGTLHRLAAQAPGAWHLDQLTAPAVAEKIIDRLMLLAACLLPILLLEAGCLGYAASSLRRITTGHTASSLYDLGSFTLFFLGLWRVWTVIATLGASYWIGSMASHASVLIFGHPIEIDTGSVAANIVIYSLAFTFIDYWNHYLFHCRPFWYLHRMHHAATEMTVLSLYRNHPGTNVVQQFTRLWPLTFFAAPPGYVAGFIYAITTYEFLIHSGIGWKWGWFGRWILIPPAAHRIHHSVEFAEANSLLGIIPLWDRLFGTWHNLDGAEIVMGVTDASYNSRHFLWEAWRDLIDFGRSLGAFTLGRVRPIASISAQGNAEVVGSGD